jgi:Domain of unknown function (DUF397)
MDWRKSSYSGANGGNCVEAASGDGLILIRDTTDRAGVTMTIPVNVWQAFTDALK